MHRSSLVIAIGWTAFVLASAIPALFIAADALENNPQERYLDPLTGVWKWALYRHFFTWWLPVLVPVLLLGFACRFVDWRRD